MGSVCVVVGLVVVCVVGVGCVWLVVEGVRVKGGTGKYLRHR